MYVVNVERSLNRFTIEIFLSLFEFLGGLFNFPSCRVGAYSRVGAYLKSRFSQKVKNIFRLNDILYLVHKDRIKLTVYMK